MKKLFVFLLCIFFSGLNAQPTIEFVVSSSPGGPTDTITRKVAEILYKETNINYLVLNKPGANHQIAYNYLSNSSKPTLIISTSEIKNHNVINQVNMIYEIGKFEIYLFSSSVLNLQSINDLIHLSKTKEIIIGSSQTFSYRGMEFVCNFLDKCLNINYKSGNEGILALMKNEIDVFPVVSYGTNNYLKNNKVTLIYKFQIDNNELALYSKNIDKNLEIKIKQILTNYINSNFRKEFGLIQ